MAQYREGTVTCTANSATVSGIGTRWVVAGIQPGHWFTVRGQGITYTVASVISDTQLVLNGAYQGSTEAGLFYLIHTEYTPRGYAVPGPGDVDATLIVARAIYEIDADMTAHLGAPVGSATKVRISDILDLNSSTALTGQILTKLSDGSYGFTAPAALSVSISNLGSTTIDTGLVYSGTSPTGSHQFRGIQVLGGSISQNPDRLTITIPAVGETNTLASVGTAASTSIVAPKSGTVLNAYGLLGTNGVTVSRSGNDVVISGTGTGSTPIGTGEANTAENLGTGTTSVVRVFSDKSGVSLRFRSILMNPDHFTVTGETTGQYSIGLRRQRLADSPDVSIAGASPGQIIRLEADNIWRAQALPPSGIASVQADPAPRLGGDLTITGRRIIGIANTLSGMIERPKAKKYTLILKANAAVSITSLTALTETGSLLVEVFAGADLGPVVGTTSLAPISGVTSALPLDFVPNTPLSIPIGGRLTMRLSSLSAGTADFLYSIAWVSA